MKKIKRSLYKQVKKVPIQKTEYPVINSITLKKQISKHTIRKSLIKQMFRTVQWKKTMDIIKSQSDVIIEVSTNNILTKLNIIDNNMCIPINNKKNINHLIKLL